jgi:hypothetical protein
MAQIMKAVDFQTLTDSSIEILECGPEFMNPAGEQPGLA